MQLFSKRFPMFRSGVYTRYRGSPEDNALLSSPTRMRLINELRYIISCGTFIENFLLIQDPEDKSVYLNDTAIREIFNREIGYDVTNLIDVKTLEFRETDKEKSSRDPYLFDLVEVVIIFAREKERDNVCARIQEIFNEENSPFQLNNHLIFSKDSTSLRGLIPLIKNQLLRKKLASYYNSQRIDTGDEVLAQISADLVQFLFSDENEQKNTKKASEQICSEIAQKWTKSAKADELQVLLSDLVKIIKSLNNRISDIRHTDQHTISVQSTALYKLITSNNIHLTETVIQTLPNQYIMEEKAEDIKIKYLGKYNIDPTKLDVLDLPSDDVPF